MNVLMISPQYPPLTGGYELAAQRLSTELARRGNRVTVVTERIYRNWPAREVSDGVEVRRLFTVFRRRVHVLTAMVSLGWYLLWHGRRFDVWHVHQYREAAVVAALLGRLLSRPVVLKLTSSGAGGIANMAAATRFPKLAAWTVRNVSACIAVSRETEAEAVAFGIPADRITRIGNGVDVERFRPLADGDERQRVRSSLGVKTPYLAAWVGRLSEEKNPVGALEAWARLADAPATGWTLALIGDGVLRDEVRAAVARLGLEARVILAGHRDDLDAWLRASDLYLLTSHREGLSNTTMEALAAGVPVVTTAVSGMSELVGEPGSGELVAPGDMEALAVALARLVSDPGKREEMGRRGRAAIVERYSIHSVTDQHTRLYESIIGSG